MQIIIFLIEVSLIFLLVDMDNISSKNTKLENDQYSSYYSLDESGNSILILKEKISLEEKIDIWKNSSVKDEMLTFFPDIELMSEVIQNRILEDEGFKTSFIGYLEYVQGRYLAGKITQDEFRDALANPNPSLPNY